MTIVSPKANAVPDRLCATIETLAASASVAAIDVRRDRPIALVSLDIQIAPTYHPLLRIRSFNRGSDYDLGVVLLGGAPTRVERRIGRIMNLRDQGSLFDSYVPGTMTRAAAWVVDEDARSRESRIARLNWVASRYPSIDFATFPGGMTALLLFEEMRYCFVYGQFLSSILTGLAYFERTLAGSFYAGGRSEMERAPLHLLLAEARAAGQISERDFEKVERIRRTRNPIAHFRAPFDADSIEARAWSSRTGLVDLVECDAKILLECAYKLLKERTL